MCVYEIEGTRNKIIGPICTLTGRGCFIESELDKPLCLRRAWANQYQMKASSPEAPRSPMAASGGTI